MTIAHIKHFNIGDQLFAQRICTETDATSIIDANDDAEEPKVLMLVTFSCEVIFPEYGDDYHGRMYMNAIEEWLYQPLPGSPLNIPFSTGNKDLLKGEIELFKTFYQAKHMGVE